MMWIRLASAVVVLQAIVSALAIPLLLALGDSSADLRLVVAATIALLFAPAFFRRKVGRWIGWLVEVLSVIAAIGLPTLLGLNLVFVVMWWYALRLGDRIDRDRQAAAG